MDEATLMHSSSQPVGGAPRWWLESTPRQREHFNQMHDRSSFEKVLYELPRHLNNQMVRQSLTDFNIDPERLRSWISAWRAKENTQFLYRQEGEQLYTPGFRLMPEAAGTPPHPVESFPPNTAAPLTDESVTTLG